METFSTQVTVSVDLAPEASTTSPPAVAWPMKVMPPTASMVMAEPAAPEVRAIATRPPAVPTSTPQPLSSLLGAKVVCSEMLPVAVIEEFR